MTKKYGILAYPAKHSLSPVMHNAAFKALKIDAKYHTFEIAEKDLDVFFQIVKSEPISGISISLPYKEKAMKYLDRLNEDARKIGAINTIINFEGNLFGFNTDYLAATKALFMDLPAGTKIPKDNVVAVIIGAGGAARAVCYGLLKLGIHVWVANRTKAKADRMALEFAEMFKAEIHSVAMSNVGYGDILINTASIWTKNPGMKMMDLPNFCKPDYMKNFKLVMDICYNPLETPLIKCAKKLGIPFVTGDKMLLYQAIDQFELFTEKRPPVGVMKRALEKAVKEL